MRRFSAAFFLSVFKKNKQSKAAHFPPLLFFRFSRKTSKAKRRESAALQKKAKPCCSCDSWRPLCFTWRLGGLFPGKIKTTKDKIRSLARAALRPEEEKFRTDMEDHHEKPAGVRPRSESPRGARPDIQRQRPREAQTPPVVLPNGPLRLADCLAISRERQPILTVAHPSRHRSEQARRAWKVWTDLWCGINHDRPMRLQQAKTEHPGSRPNCRIHRVENRYVVTRLYISVLYSRAQRSVLDDLVDDLTELRRRVQESVEKKERPEWTATTVDLITLYLRRAEAQRAKALGGINLSLAALRGHSMCRPTSA